MAEKKAVLVVAGKAAIKSGANIDNLNKKAVLVNSYTGGDVLGTALKVEGVVKADAAEVAANIEKGTALTVVDLGAADDAALDAALAKILEAVDRRTTTVVAGDKAVAFHGNGIAKGVEFKGAVSAADLIPTIACIADVFLPGDIANGAVIYPVVKDPNARLKEIGKLQESIQRMQAAMERDTREPWDKHDCA